MADDDRQVQSLTVGQVAKMLDVTPRFVQILVKDGFIRQEKRGEYRVLDVVRGLKAYYEDRLDQASKKSAANRASDARTRQIEQQMEIRTRTLVPRSDFYRAQDFVIAQHRSEISGLPARVTRDVPLRRKIEEEIDRIFARTAERIERAAHALEEGGAVLDALGETNAGPVGGEE